MDTTAGREDDNYCQVLVLVPGTTAAELLRVVNRPGTCRLSNEAFSLSSQSGPPSWSADTDEASGIGSIVVAAILAAVVLLLVAQIRMMFGRSVKPLDELMSCDC